MWYTITQSFPLPFDPSCRDGVFFARAKSTQGRRNGVVLGEVFASVMPEGAWRHRQTLNPTTVTPPAVPKDFHTTSVSLPRLLQYTCSFVGPQHIIL